MGTNEKVELSPEEALELLSKLSKTDQKGLLDLANKDILETHNKEEANAIASENAKNAHKALLKEISEHEQEKLSVAYLNEKYPKGPKSRPRREQPENQSKEELLEKMLEAAKAPGRSDFQIALEIEPMLNLNDPPMKNSELLKRRQSGRGR